MYKPKDPVSKYTDLELALMVLMNCYGSGKQRKAALGDRYTAVQTIVTYIVATNLIPAGPRVDPDLDDVRRTLEVFRPTDQEYDEFMAEFINALKKEAKDEQA